jgi:hypothetical protein
LSDVEICVSIVESSNPHILEETKMRKMDLVEIFPMNPKSLISLPYPRTARHLQSSIVGDLIPIKPKLTAGRCLLEEIATILFQRSPSLCEHIVWCVTDEEPQADCQTILASLLVATESGAQIEDLKFQQLQSGALDLLNWQRLIDSDGRWADDGHEATGNTAPVSPETQEPGDGFNGFKSAGNSNEAERAFALKIAGRLRAIADEKNEVTLRFGDTEKKYVVSESANSEDPPNREIDFYCVVNSMSFRNKQIQLYASDGVPSTLFSGESCTLCLPIDIYQSMHSVFQPQANCIFHLFEIRDGDGKLTYTLKHFSVLERDPDLLS